MTMSLVRSGTELNDASTSAQVGRNKAYLPVPGDKITRDGMTVELFSTATLPTAHGDFKVFVFRNNQDQHEHLALVRGEVRGYHHVPVRIHSECLTGDVLGSLRCDCRGQLERSMELLGRAESGILLYLRQEGRGIGLGNKVRAYALQELGLDTFEANEHLGFDGDLRRYDMAARMLDLFGPESVSLFTNNPRKVLGLRAAGVEVTAVEPLHGQTNPHNSRYIETKAKHGHHVAIA